MNYTRRDMKDIAHNGAMAMCGSGRISNDLASAVAAITRLSKAQTDVEMAKLAVMTALLVSTISDRFDGLKVSLEELTQFAEVMADREHAPPSPGQSAIISEFQRNFELHLDLYKRP